MLYTRNPAGYEFRWYDGSVLIEVFHPDAIYPELPVAAIHAGNLKRSESDLRKFANETPEYGRPYNA